MKIRSLALSIFALLLAFPATAQLPPGQGIAIGYTNVQYGVEGNCLNITNGKVGQQACSSGSGTVTSVSVTTANGVSGSVATPTTTPAITLTLGAITPSSVASSGPITVTSASASALAVGLNGATNPAFSVDASLASQAAGLNVQGNTASGIVRVAILSSGTNNSLQIDGKGTGTVTINNTATGGITLARATTISTGGLSVNAGNISVVNGGVSINASANTFSWNGSTILGNNAVNGGLSVTTSGGVGSFLDFTTNSIVKFRNLANNADAAITAGNATFSGATITMSALPSDAATTDNSVCVTTGTGVLSKGSGTLGICLGTSSARYKQDIIAEQDGLAEITSLRPVNYRYRAGHGDNGARDQYGFLAEDVIHVLPKLVGLDSKGQPNTVDILGMFPVMVTAIQELNAKIARLESAR